MSISDWSIRESSFVGETLGGDLVGLGYSQDRGCRRGQGWVAVGVSVGNSARARDGAMSGLVQVTTAVRVRVRAGDRNGSVCAS